MKLPDEPERPLPGILNAGGWSNRGSEVIRRATCSSDSGFCTTEFSEWGGTLHLLLPRCSRPASNLV